LLCAQSHVGLSALVLELRYSTISVSRLPLSTCEPGPSCKPTPRCQNGLTALSKWLGFATDDLAGERINDLTARIAFLWTDAPPPAEPASFENHEASLRLLNGEQRHVWLSARPLQDDDRALHLITLQDITARVQAEHQVRQLKRLYAALSQVNQTIVRVQSRTELYQSICDVAVRFGEFSAAWLGLWSEATDTLHPIVVRTTTEELPLERISESLPVPRSAPANDLVVVALRSSRVMTAADVDDTGARPVWPTALAEPAHQAVAVIPFRLRGKTIGVVGLVGPDAGSLTSADEIRLLDEMGLDISYALDMLQTAAESRQAQSEVRAQAVRLQILADASQAFTAVGGDYSALLAEIVRRVAEQIGESCGIRLVSPDGRTLTLAATHSTYPEALDIVRAVQPQAPERVDGPGLLPHVVRTGESVFLPEVTEEQSRASMSAALWSKLEHYRFRSLILVPLRAHGQNLGVMLVGRHTLALGPYTPGARALHARRSPPGRGPRQPGRVGHLECPPASAGAGGVGRATPNRGGAPRQRSDAPAFHRTCPGGAGDVRSRDALPGCQPSLVARLRARRH